MARTRRTGSGGVLQECETVCLQAAANAILRLEDCNEADQPDPRSGEGGLRGERVGRGQGETQFELALFCLLVFSFCKVCRHVENNVLPLWIVF